MIQYDDSEWYPSWKSKSQRVSPNFLRDEGNFEYHPQICIGMFCPKKTDGFHVTCLFKIKTVYARSFSVEKQEEIMIYFVSASKSWWLCPTWNPKCNNALPKKLLGEIRKLPETTPVFFWWLRVVLVGTFPHPAKVLDAAWQVRH